MTDHSTIQVKAEQHALKMAQREAQNGFEYEYLFTYADEQNTPIYWKIRLKNHNTGDKWCVYPMYDFAHPIEDAIEARNSYILVNKLPNPLSVLITK